MADMKTYSDNEIQDKLKSELPQWEYRDGWIRRRYKTPGWPHTMMLVNAIAFMAESVYHHPDLNVSFAMVDVKLQTHSAKGITDRDFKLAKFIEERATWQPEEGGTYEGFQGGTGKKWFR